MAYKTPGVYVEEISTFPPSVVSVETAIPAFIGYTRQALDSDGGSLLFVPTRITSLLEFETRYGKGFVPASYRVQLGGAQASNTVGAVEPRDAANVPRRYYLHDSLRHYYANGGGPCYVISIATYSTAPDPGNAAALTGFRDGLDRIARVDEPTLLVFPDAVVLSAADLASLQVTALAQCERLQDRFVIMDLRQGDQPVSIGTDPIGDFRHNVGINSLKYGAAYYPWVRSSYAPEVHFRQLAVVDTAAAAIPNNILDALTGTPAIDGLVPTVRTADGIVNTVVGSVNLAGMSANTLSLDRANFARLADHFQMLSNRLQQTAPNASIATLRPLFADLLILPRAIALVFRTLQQTANLPATLALQITALSGDTALRSAISRLIALEKNANVRASATQNRQVADVENDYQSLTGTPWILPNLNVAAAIPADATDFAGTNPNDRRTALNAAAAIKPLFDTLSSAILSLFTAAEFLANDAEKRLFQQHPVYRDIAAQVGRAMTLLPASGAVAGVYAAVDRTRGVWKAPANVSLVDVSGPAVKLNDAQQEDLNVTTTGKSINAIRAFAGKGTLIWGARTLAGNDNEWRYVPVRRFFNMAEESIKKATEPFVFEPNDRNTWVRVRAMIENFLTVQWRQGALAGAVPQQAFYVKVGLGETMTAQNILDGQMIIEIGMAVVRPAEFIVLKFAHKMQTS